MMFIEITDYAGLIWVQVMQLELEGFNGMLPGIPLMKYILHWSLRALQTLISITKTALSLIIALFKFDKSCYAY